MSAATRMGDADVRLWMLASDSDLPHPLGVLAEVTADGVTRRYRSGGWWPTKDTAERLRDRDHLAFEHEPDRFEGPDRAEIAGLRRALEQVALARRIATEAHAGQVDKNGAPYIEHPRRVARRLAGLDEQAAAWLHDVVEDTAVTAGDLRASGIDDAVVDAVVLLTRTAADDAGYYAAIAASPLARAVKLADIADNTDRRRTARLDPTTRARLAAKYEAARTALGATR